MDYGELLDRINELCKDHEVRVLERFELRPHVGKVPNIRLDFKPSDKPGEVPVLELYQFHRGYDINEYSPRPNVITIVISTPEVVHDSV